jgi:hypothetical protein
VPVDPIAEHEIDVMGSFRCRCPTRRQSAARAARRRAVIDPISRAVAGGVAKIVVP